MNNISIRKQGFSIVELIVVILILSLFFLMISQLFQHFFTQRVQQDKQTVFWLTYCRTMDRIREDLRKATSYNSDSPTKFVISIIRMGNDYKCEFGTITWEIKDQQTIVRSTDEGEVNTFAFAGGLERDDIINMVVRKAP